MAQFSEKIKPN